jgi:hypothetical protein
MIQKSSSDVKTKIYPFIQRFYRINYTFALSVVHFGHTWMAFIIIILCLLSFFFVIKDLCIAVIFVLHRDHIFANPFCCQNWPISFINLDITSLGRRYLFCIFCLQTFQWKTTTEKKRGMYKLKFWTVFKVSWRVIIHLY